MAQKLKLNSIFKMNCIDLQLVPLSIKVPQSCFQILLTAKCETPTKAKFELKVKPDPVDAGYELIVDYKLSVDNRSEMVQKDKWSREETLLSFEHDSSYINTLELFFNLVESLSPQDITKATNLRNFNVLTSDRSFFVNTAQLNSLGGRLFKEWYERECQGEQNAVVQSINSDELEELLQACSAYGPTTTIHRKNFRKILEIAEKEKIVGLLRAVESFIMDSVTIHPIRKLEYAAEHRMSRLADTVLRSFPTPLARIDALFSYMEENGDEYVGIADMHLDVLKMLEIYDDHIIL